MDTVTLTVKNQPGLYLELENFNPDTFAGKTAAGIEKLPVYMGKETDTLGDFFTVVGDAGATPEETRIVVNGNCTRMKYIGAKMTAGEVIVNSSCDMYTGSWMEGGKLTVNGDVTAFCGLAMKGGEFTIIGNAGNYLGAAYRGDWRGMSGGILRVGGNAGSDAAGFMTGGTLIVKGNADIHLGTHMDGGTIVLKGNADRRVGGQMVSGSIYVLGTIGHMLPGYRAVGEVGLEIDGTKATFTDYIGDLGERHPKKKGELVYGHLFLKKS